MLKLIIEDDEGRKTVVPFVRDEITIGRLEGNTIRLTERNVSRRHARLLRQNGSVMVEDLGSYNGIRVNGEKIEGRAPLTDGDLVQIGDYDLAIQHEGADQPVNAPTPPPEAHGHRANGLGAHREEPETEASSPVYEEAEPLNDDGDDDTAPSQKRPDAESVRRQSTSIIRVDQVEAGRSRQVLELDPEEAPRLVVLNTEFAGREFACIRTELRIGRTDDNDITLDHRSLSRTHAKIVREDSGEWRVIDMQSANGLTVNGEPYAQATLNHLDTIELGHLKLKFVGAGESFSFVPGAEDRPGAPAKSKSRAPVIIGVTAVVALIAAAGVFISMGRDKGQPPQPETPAQKQTPAQAQAKAGAPATQPVEPAAAAQAKQHQEPQADPVVAATAEANQKLNLAKTAIANNDFDKAIPLLDAVKTIASVPRASVTEAEDLLDKAKAEKLMKQRLDGAQKALDDGEYAEARKLLDDASATEAFADRYRSLDEAVNAKLDEAAAAEAKREQQEKEEARKAALAAKSKPQPREQVKPASAVSDDAAKLFDEGKKLLEKRQTREARATLLKCVELNPRYAPCHLLLGAAHAKLGEVDQGAKHYDMFLKLAPDAPEAPKVRLMLQQYRDTQKQ